MKGEYTGYNDMHDNRICLGDSVRIGGMYYEVIKNPFSGLYVIDGDTGQEYLVNIYKQVVVVAPSFSIDELSINILSLRRTFIQKYGIAPNRAFIDTNIVEAAKQEMKKDIRYPDGIFPGAKIVLTIVGLEIVEVKEYGHVSVGLIMK